MEYNQSFFVFDSEDTEHSASVNKEDLLSYDGGYFDTLVAIGFAAMVDAYYDLKDSPRISKTPSGYSVEYQEAGYKEYPELSWLKYSVAGSWRNGKEDQWKAPKGHTLKQPGWDKLQTISTEGAEVDVSAEKEIGIIIGEKSYSITDPERQLYGVINKLGKPDWLNLCVYACRNQGRVIIENTFEEASISFNSIVMPQVSKGAFSKDSFAINNGSLPKSMSTPLSRSLCLAVAGLIVSGIGQSPKKGMQGFAIPSPRSMQLEVVRHMVSGNRRRFVNGGFFFAYDNYLNYIKLLLTYNEDKNLSNEEQSLDGVCGAGFISLGNSSSPNSSWKMIVPNHNYSIDSVERLQMLLVKWKQAKRKGANNTLSIDRAAVAQLVRGFENSEIQSLTEGYLKYIYDVGLASGERSFYALNQNIFIEVMKKYQQLLEEFESEEIRKFIDLIRRETYNAVYPPRGQATSQPNYQLIRRLREVQNSEDFILAITQIAIDRGVTKLATAKGNSDKTKYWANPYEYSIKKLILLAEGDKYSPKLISQLVLALALCRRPGESDPAEKEQNSEESADTEDSINQ